MRDLDFLGGKGSDEISGFQLWQSRPSALSAFALSAVGPCQQNPNLNVTSHPLHLAACHHRPSFFHPSFFGPPLAGLQALFTCFRFRVAARRALEAASIFPLRSTLPRLLAVPFLFVRRLGRKEIRPRPNTPDSRTPLATFIAGWRMQVASVQAPIVEPSPSRTARATSSCVARLPRHRCSVTARPWRRPVMFRFSHAYPPSGFRELRGSAARNPGPKKGFLGCCHR